MTGGLRVTGGLRFGYSAADVLFMLMGALVGPIRFLLEGPSPQLMIPELCGHLESLCLGYLEREGRPKLS